MIINKMDDILMKIYSIKNIEEIEFRELVPTNNSDYMSLVPCLYVRYDSGKTLDLCSLDKYFDIFVKKVFEVYNLEKGKVIKDYDYSPFRHSILKIDDKSKKLLSSGRLTEINDLYSFYEGKKSYDYNLLIESDELNGLIPILIHQIKSLYDLTDVKVNFEDLTLNGYRTNYTINVKINGLDDILYINYKKIDDTTYIFNIRSKNKDFKDTTVYINFKKTGISIITSISEFNLSSENDYLIDGSSLRLDSSITKDDKLVSYNSSLVDTCINDKSDITSLDSTDNCTWYKLPWGSLYGIENVSEELSSTESINKIHTKYFTDINGNYSIREYFGKKYHRNKTFEVDSYDLTLEECIKNMNLVHLFDGIYLVETHFSDDASENGYYKTYLDNKYYYHLIDSKLGFNKSNLISISSDNNIIYGADLLNSNDVIKLVRGDK